MFKEKDVMIIEKQARRKWNTKGDSSEQLPITERHPSNLLGTTPSFSILRLKLALLLRLYGKLSPIFLVSVKTPDLRVTLCFSTELDFQ